MRKFLGRLVSLVVLSLAWIVGGRMLAQRWEREADRAWTAVGSPMTSFAQRFPKRVSNEAARKLDDVAARLGIEMAPLGAAGRPHPSAADEKALETVRPDLAAWLTAQLADPSDLVVAPPQKVAAFLSGQAPGFQYLVAQLRAGGVPAWEQDLDRLADAPIPYLKGQRVLSQLLCASALEAQRQGRGAEGLETMEAAAKVSASLRDRPELVSRAVEIGLLVEQAGALRKIDGVPPEWYARATERDLRRSLLVSLQTEAWLIDRLLERSEALGNVLSMNGGAAKASPALLDRVAMLYQRPYALLAASDYSRATARTAAAVQEQAACAFERDAWKGVEEQAKSGIGRWNLVGRMARPSVTSLWAAADHLRFHQELTSKVLELKRLREASPEGAWPQQAPGIESSTCPGNRWTYVVSADGRAVLTASQSPSAPVPAVRFEGAPPAPAKPAVTPVKRKSS